MSKTWKAVEQRLAKRLDGERIGCTGGATPDVVSDWLSIEIKTRKRLPQWLKDAIAQAVSNVWGYRLPVVILHEIGQHHDDDLVLLKLKDFEAWFGEVRS